MNSRNNGPKVVNVPQATDTPSIEELIPRKGNYKALITYQKAEAIYDMTYYFCSRHLRRGDRTVDQMVQAARSGKQNIVEGSAASATSESLRLREDTFPGSVKSVESVESVDNIPPLLRIQSGGGQPHTKMATGNLDDRLRNNHPRLFGAIQDFTS